jgi:hypothetical protein
VSSLEQQKTALRERIAMQRQASAEAAGRVLQPVRWVDDGMRAWRKIPPVARAAAIPSVLFFLKSVFPRAQTIIRWVPAVAGLWTAVRARRKESVP